MARLISLAARCAAALVLSASTVAAELPNPTLSTVFPPGGQAGTNFEVTIAGNALQSATALRCSRTEITFERIAADRFRAAIPEDTPPGSYDLRAFGPAGLSSPRIFVVSNRPEFIETEANDTLDIAAELSIPRVVSGRIEKAGDVDCYRFGAAAGQRVIIDCLADRIDSSARVVLELYDTAGKRLASNRGYFGIDPLIDFPVPADGQYVVRLFDLTYSGGAAHIYRLALDTGPRAATAHPCVVQTGQPARVSIYGWNLSGDSAAFDHVAVEITQEEIAALARNKPLGVYRRSYQASVDGFAYHLPNSQSPILLGLTDVPVILDAAENHSPGSAQEIAVPCEVSGRLAAGNETDWYAITVQRGDVLRLEGYGQRIGSPVDLDVIVLDGGAEEELARFSDQRENLGGTRFPTSHLDPAGRWVAPRAGRYLLAVRNLTGGLHEDARRVYRLSVRREEWDFRLAAVSPVGEPAGLNLYRGGRADLEVIAFRRRGLDGPIRVAAVDLPTGVTCPDIWLGPGVSRGPLVVSADDSAEPFVGALKLTGTVDLGGAEISQPVRGGTMVRGGTPNGLGRMTDEVPLAVLGRAPLRITTSVKHTRGHVLYGDLTVHHAQGSILDLEVQVERRDRGHESAVELTGVGLPEPVRNTVATIPAGESKGYISFYLPSTVAPGRYSVALRAATTAPPAAGSKPAPISVVSNVVSFDVAPASYIIDLEPRAPRKIRRGEYLQVNYTCTRKNGFIGKIHTEISAPDKVIGLRARGVTFVGQTESGNIQIVADEDAPLGRQPFLRFYAVGTIEDQPILHGHCFLDLEIVE